MNSSVVLLALLVGAAPSPTWLTSYRAALERSKTEQKPLVVAVGKGSEGWKQLCRGASLEADSAQLLADRYVCLYIDTANPAGRQLAALFDIKQKTGLVIGDAGASLMAYHHEGDLSRADLLRSLRKYSDPQRVVRTTETNPAVRRSYYPPAPRPAMMAPSFFGGSFGGGGRC